MQQQQQWLLHHHQQQQRVACCGVLSRLGCELCLCERVRGLSVHQALSVQQQGVHPVRQWHSTALWRCGQKCSAAEREQGVLPGAVQCKEQYSAKFDNLRCRG
jgi:hypothetical protein